MIHSGQPVRDFIDSATRHVLLRQGVLGIKVKIMRGTDPDSKAGNNKSLPDTVTVIEPKEEVPITTPSSQDYVRTLNLNITYNKELIRHYRVPSLPLLPLLPSKLPKRLLRRTKELRPEMRATRRRRLRPILSLIGSSVLVLGCIFGGF